MSLLNEDIQREIQLDLKKSIAKNSMFLSEESHNEKIKDLKEVQGNHKVGHASNKPNISSKTGEILKSSKVYMNKIKTMDEEDLINNPPPVKTLFKTACKFAIASTILGGPIGGIVAFLVEKQLKKGVKLEKRRQLYTTLSADLKVLEKKIEELDELKKLSKQQKEQRYALISLRETTSRNLARLKAKIEYGD